VKRDRSVGRMMSSTLVVGTLVMIMSTASFGGQPAPLRLHLSTSAGEYRFGESIEMDVRLENVSDDLVTVFGSLRWGQAGGFVLHVEDAAGRDVQPKNLDDDMIPPSVLKKPTAYVTLQERHFLGTSRSDKSEELFRKPGTYTMWLDYTSPVPSAFGQGVNFWSRESGTLRSNRVTIHIKESPR
jgi:hypothetical protein